MAFNKKTWLDRITEFPTRRTLTKSDQSTEVVDVARNEGDIMQEGDAFSAANMNDLEQRIEQGIAESNSNARWNPVTKMYQVYFEGQWYDDHYFDPVWDGYIYNNGVWSPEHFTTTWVCAGIYGYGAAASVSAKATYFELDGYAGTGGNGASAFTMDKGIDITKPCKLRIEWTNAGSINDNAWVNHWYLREDHSASDANAVITSPSVASATSYEFTLTDASYIGRTLYLGRTLAGPLYNAHNYCRIKSIKMTYLD